MKVLRDGEYVDVISENLQVTERAKDAIHRAAHRNLRVLFMKKCVVGEDKIVATIKGFSDYLGLRDCYEAVDEEGQTLFFGLDDIVEVISDIEVEDENGMWRGIKIT